MTNTDGPPPVPEALRERVADIVAEYGAEVFATAKGDEAHDLAELTQEATAELLAALSPPPLGDVAALALHNQPFGFTWEDVDALRAEAERGEYADRTGDNAGYSSIDPPHARSLADRIAARLPPRTRPHE